MEDGLRVVRKAGNRARKKGLNPCFSGRWSARISQLRRLRCSSQVLILVLVEDGLREPFHEEPRDVEYVLILVLVEDGLRV